MEKGGGKSLELMQRRLLSGQPEASSANQQPKQQQQPQQQQPPPPPPQQQQQQQQQQQINQNPRPGKSAASLMATQAREQAAATQSTMLSQPVAPSRPKGKDFAAMAMSVGAAKSKGGPTQQQQQQQQQAPSSGAPSQAPRPSPAAPSRPKGKDFSAMANRMGPPPQPPAQQQPVPAPLNQQGARTSHQQQAANAEMEERAKLRAQQMQDAARAAAGLPPLSRPTASTPSTPSKTNNVNPTAPRGVTTMPPTVNHPPQQNVRSFPPQQNVLPQQQQQQLQRAPQPNVVRPQQATQRNVPKPQAPKRTSSTSRSIQPGTTSARGSQQSSTSTAGHGQGRYSAKPRTTPPKVSAEPPASEAKVTPAPHLHEGRLAFTAARAPSGAHAAPLVGQRIQDLVKSIDQNYTIDSEAEEQVLQLADDFLDKVVSQGLRLANHRGSKSLDVQDLQLVLAKHWGIVVPGLGLPNIRSSTPGKQTTPKTGGIAGPGSVAKRKASDSAGSGPKKKPNVNSIPAASMTTST